jgi:hypothetical protein
MAFSRILVLQSVEDYITESRMRRMRTSPLLEGCEFECCYAVELTGAQRELPTFTMMGAVEDSVLDKDSLAVRISRKVITFNPDLLVVHFGFVFQRFPEKLLAALESVKTSFPKLKFGIEDAAFVISRFPGAARIFDDDDEIRRLIDCMF